MTYLTRVLVILTVVVCLGTNARATETVESILYKYIEAVGGQEAIEKLTSRVCVGKQVTDLSSEEHPSYESLHLETHAKTPASYCIETWSDQGGYREGFDGEVGWVKDICSVRTNPEADGNRLAYLLNPQGPLHVEACFPELKYVGTSVLNGEKVHALEPANLKPAQYTLYFSSESGLLVAIGHFWSVEDYRQVDGVMVPQQISVSRKGGSSVYHLESVIHNVEISDSLFAIPE